MKKFSKVTGVQVSSEPIVKEDVQHDIRNTIMNLIDNSLRLTSYGSARQEIQATTKITGKEMLVESLINLFKDKEMASAIKSLELLKENIHDWKTIDENIDLIKENQTCITFLNENNEHVKGILKLLDRVTEDNIEPLMETLIVKYTPESLSFNERVVSNMIKSEQYDSKKLSLVQQYFIGKID